VIPDPKEYSRVRKYALGRWYHDVISRTRFPGLPTRTPFTTGTENLAFSTVVLAPGTIVTDPRYATGPCLRRRRMRPIWLLEMTTRGH
jgi:hypothetical protein